MWAARRSAVRVTTRFVTLTQLECFVLVARLGSVTAAARALGVSEPAVSSTLAALRQHLGDPLVARGPAGMELTAAGRRLVPIASQMIHLGAEAQATVRQARGAAPELRILASSTRDVQAIRAVDGKPLPVAPGPLTRHASEVFAQRCQEVDP